MRPCEIVELFPIGELPFQVHVIGIVEELIEFLLVGPVRPFNLAVELRAYGPDVSVPDTAVLDVSVELGLELVAAVGPDALDAEGEFLDDVFDEVDSIGLVVTAVDFKSPDAGCIIDCGVLVALDDVASFAFEDEELDVDLDMMTRDLFLVSLGMNGPRSGFARKTAQAVAPQNAIDAGV